MFVPVFDTRTKQEQCKARHLRLALGLP
jgi:hypothetical protein